MKHLVTNIYWDCYEAQRRMFEDFKPGQRVLVKILIVTPNQFSASIKHLNPEKDPWWDPGIYSRGTLHHGIVRLIFDFGAAMVRLENGAEAFVEKLDPETRVNDPVNVVITAVNIESKRIDGQQMESASVGS
jgi:ribosomal protein S1